MKLAAGIRTLAKRGQYGHSRHPRNFYMSEGGHSYYWDNQRIFASQAEWDRACRLLARYRRFCEFVEGWSEVPGSRAYYADNSTQCTQISRAGKTRNVVLCGPGGDACF
jgi:hypothetical protein